MSRYMSSVRYVRKVKYFSKWGYYFLLDSKHVRRYYNMLSSDFQKCCRDDHVSLASKMFKIIINVKIRKNFVWEANVSKFLEIDFHLSSLLLKFLLQNLQGV
ncbi:hypothetical protein [Sulfolobus acidocaldarius]|nr:hypothetical protein [Sulfolobus acidocaldarius]